MGHAGLEAKWDEMGIVQAGGVGGPGTGSGRVDAIGYRPGELHVGECKGGTSAKVGTYEVDGGWCQWVVAMSWLNASVGVR